MDIFKIKEYAENELIDNIINDKENALNLAMKYKLVTPWTSMIVVKNENDENDDNNTIERHPQEIYYQMYLYKQMLYHHDAMPMSANRSYARSSHSHQIDQECDIVVLVCCDDDDDEWGCV